MFVELDDRTAPGHPAASFWLQTIPPRGIVKSAARGLRPGILASCRGVPFLVRHLRLRRWRGTRGCAGKLPPDLDYLTLAEIVQAPFIVRSMFRPETLADLDIEALADRLLKDLNSHSTEGL